MDKPLIILKLDSKTLFLLFVFFHLSAFAFVEERKVDSTQKDVGDLYRSIFKIKEKISNDSSNKVRLGPFYTPAPYPGYAITTGLLVGLANNISFYTHNGADAKISNIFIDNLYTQYGQSLNIVRSNIWLNHEKINLVGDWRIYKFPTNTFGLGIESKNENIDPIDFNHLKFYQILNYTVLKNTSLGIGYHLDYHWAIRETDNVDNHPTELRNYGLTKSSTSSGMSMNFQYDNRLNCNNPSQGAFLNLQLRSNTKSLGSDQNWQSVTIDARKYFMISKKRKDVLAFWSYNWLTTAGTPPYLDLPSSGFDISNNTAREYQEGRYRGRNFLYAEAQYRFKILKSGLLGATFSTSFTTVSSGYSNNITKINPALDIGLRIKINKHSNTNLCLDYGIGLNGGKGFTFNINEMF
jgi:hypothetical protein